ncbi:MAG: Asp-tRNA(Asn)/Glu-tRNA(Gln) amidotransferase subunit GatB [Clostridium sp.]|nr:Asp-tRNA(Asn)/Glu-tRNA(Gln) amidotransferase subunit GatB [Clostridium sp.]MCM1444271.1 Asp-tRNA(Asn)/Glu-tRNA(Gln) amidotransferase subunit GatB [Candidatus Amulumruptor caecigallinarius]
MYKVVIGLEVHCELKTNSKNFSGAKNDYSSIPNSNIAPVDLGFPGVLPVVNKEAVKKALKMAIALNCTTPDEIIFDRKNYFYPDLPKGYQITQMNKPVGINGYVMINVDGIDKKVLIHDTHLEEDTASLDHFGSYSLIDYNRSGIPLLETVTEPCLNSAKEAIAFLEALRSMFLYCNTSEARSDKGQMRCDVNISLMEENATELGTKVEMKNINSFNNVEKAIEYEIKRQTEVLQSGGKVIQETRRYSDEDDCTYSMRSKVDAVDYKYFVEPNIAPIKVTDDFLNSIKEEIPMLQYDRLNLYMEKYSLSRYDATILVKEKEISDYFDKCVSSNVDPKLASNWITSIILGHLNKLEISINDIFVTPEMLSYLIKMVSDGNISSKQGKEVLYKSLLEEKHPKEIIESLGISQIADDAEIRKIVIEVIEEQPKAVEDVKNGRDRILDFLVGQVMKKTKGKANPSLASNLMKEEISKR